MGATVIAPSKGRTATIIVAASNASARSIQGADFVCAGSGDQNTIASAVSALPAVGGRIQFTEGDFYTSSPYLIVNSNIDFVGMGGSTVFHSTTANACFQSSSTAFSDITFNALTFVGSVNEFPTTPKLGRTTSGNGMMRAINIHGSLDTTGSYPVISNIIIRDCIVRNSLDLPVFLSGISKKTQVLNNEFTNNRDVGFLFCDEAIFNNNHVQQTRDNGVSFSRQCNKVTCVGNTFENICFSAIDVSGFLTWTGGNNFSICGNTIKNVGQAGVLLQDAPKYGVVTGNEIDSGYFRGPSDSLSEVTCCGIVVRGFPSGSVPAYTDSTTGVLIANNRIRTAPRAGIMVDGAAAVAIKDNFILDTGTQFFSDGSTPITASDVTQNIGILFDYPTTLTNIECVGNTIMDTRGTPYMNQGIYPQPCPNVTMLNNTMIAGRNPANTPAIGINGIFGNGSDGAVTLDGTVTVPWASKASNVYTLTRDVYCTNLTINSGIAIIRGGWVINCTGTYTNNGTDSAKGTDAAGTGAGAGSTSGTQRGGTSGTAGTTTTTTGSTAVSNGLGGTGGSGGNSGANTAGTPGAVTVPPAINGGVQLASRLPYCSVGASYTPVQAAIQGWAGGTGGTGGAGDGTNAGGGGGGGAGVSILNARYVIIGSGGITKAFGGAGAAGAGGNAAGGGGGGGSGKSHKGFAAVALEAARDYAAEDADITLRLHRLLKPRVQREKMVTVYETIERPLMGVVASMERHGIKVDRTELMRLSADFGERMAEYEKQIHELAGGPFNIGSPKQLGEVLFDKLQLPGGKKGKNGAYGTDAAILEDLANQHELPRRMLDWRQLAKLKSTYADALIEQINPATGRVHTSFSLAGAATGRLASTDPNLQNIPVRSEEGRKIRRAFVAEPGNVLLSADYSQIELRLAAHVADIPALKQAFRDELDIHAMTASQVFGVPIEGMDPMVRRRAKAINFGIIYGISGFGLAQQLSISPGEASEFIKAYFLRFPEIRNYMDQTKAFCREHGYVQTIFGRKCHLPGIKDSNPARRAFSERAAINAPLQGAAADIIKRAMIRLPGQLATEGLSARMLLQVHDELVFEVPESEAERTIPVLKRVMEGACAPVLELSVPLVVEVGQAHSWDEAH